MNAIYANECPTQNAMRFGGWAKVALDTWQWCCWIPANVLSGNDEEVLAWLLTHGGYGNKDNGENWQDTPVTIIDRL
jgi:hypothetical protein